MAEMAVVATNTGNDHVTCDISCAVLGALCQHLVPTFVIICHTLILGDSLMRRGNSIVTGLVMLFGGVVASMMSRSGTVYADLSLEFIGIMTAMIMVMVMVLLTTQREEFSPGPFRLCLGSAEMRGDDLPRHAKRHTAPERRG